MRIRFEARPDFFSKPGGDTAQIQQYIDRLGPRGWTCEVGSLLDLDGGADWRAGLLSPRQHRPAV